MTFDARLDMDGTTARITLSGELDSAVADRFRQTVEDAAGFNPRNLVLFVSDLRFMASAGLRILVFAKEKMGKDVSIFVIGANGPVLNTLRMTGFDKAVYLQDAYPDR